MLRNGLDTLLDFHLLNFIAALQKAGKYIPRPRIIETVLGGAPTADKPSAMSLESWIRITGSSRTTWYREQERRRSSADTYSIVQKIGDCLCPVYPAGLDGAQLLSRLAKFAPELSYGQLTEILDYYVAQGCFELDGDTYRLTSNMVQVGLELDERISRVRNHLSGVTDALQRYVLGEPGSDFKVLQLIGTEREYAEFMNGLRDYFTEFFRRHPPNESPDREQYTIRILSDRVEKG
jgi:hypothetical protein